MIKMNFEFNQDKLDTRIAKLNKSMPGLAAAIDSLKIDSCNSYGDTKKYSPRDIAFARTSIFGVAVSKWVYKSYVRGEGGIAYSENLKIHYTRKGEDMKLGALETEFIKTRDRHDDRDDNYLGYDCSGTGIKILSDSEVLAFWHFLDKRQNYAPTYKVDLKDAKITKLNG